MTDHTTDPVVAAESLAHSVATDAARMLHMAKDPKKRQHIPYMTILGAVGLLNAAILEMEKND